MAQTAQFVIGADVSCTDGPCGQVTRVVVDPVARTVTHLVVEPRHRQGLGRLVPLDLISGTAARIRLRCTRAEFAQLVSAEETQFIPGTAGYAAYGPGQVLAWPYYGLGAMGTTAIPDGPGPAEQLVTYDSVPAGEVAVHRGDHVQATDGAIGRVQGLVVEPRSHRVTHVLLAEGHLWGRQDVAIPVSAVRRTDDVDGIQLSISRAEVRDLPPVDIQHSAG
jgi:sporulation protein YlmC with PRC-barrel domain